MATADKPHSPLTVEPAPLPVDATAAAALCGEHLLTWRGWDVAVVRTAGHQQPLDAI
ncbi:MAG: hypothetical protein RLZZ436_1474 [Planctomycetota bacterium]|jgi:hypothetical protein